MESILKSEIFFFISSISVILITVIFIIFIIFSFYLIKIMRNFSHISDRLKKTVDEAASSLEEVGDNIRESSIFNFFFGKKKKSKK
jgi:flagellar biosynthesis/type III secretory pathway M-ring protein FliF/YscJ